MSTVEASPVRLFPNYMQMRPILPRWVWHVARTISIATVLTIIVLLFVMPDMGLFLFWRIAIPILPALFLLAPGLWRNICPLAATNQIPRLFGWTRGLTLPKWLREYYYVIGIALFLLIAASRKVLFNGNGPALGILLLLILATAFTGGMVFKGKSGWCSSICPLLPVQRIYGQTPFATVRNSHCAPCVGCTKNCYDFNPRVAYLADLYDDDRYYSGYRKFFAAAFPAFILGFYTIPNPPQISVLEIYLQFAVYILIGVGSFYLLDSFVKVSANKLTALYGALAFNLYYWFTMPLFLGAFVATVPDALIWTLRVAVFGLTAVWVLRTYRKERLFISQATAPAGVRAGSTSALAARRAAQEEKPEVTFEPGDKRAVVEPKATLLEVAEAQGLAIESGCRMGVCGADPVCIRHGMENLSPVGEDERSTIERLGLAANTRMACSARVMGPVTVALKPERAGAAAAAPAGDSESAPAFPYDPAIKRVVIIGNGIAGVTAADYLRRHHPDCEIHLVGREQHHLYNRMAITRLVYGRSAMQGLYLLPDDWYDDHKVTTWLNTRALRIDRDSKEVQLGTGDTLPYDRLILASGSSSTIPPITGFGLPGTFVLREAADAMAIRSYTQENNAREALIAGGGLLGLEAAYALHKLHLHVAVLERSDRLLRRQLDAAGSQLLRSYLEGMGINIIPDAETATVEGDGRLQRVALKDGRILECDLLLAAAGISSNVDLAREAGLAVGKGVVVDGQMHSSDPAIWAIGDVAEYNGQVYGLWPAAVDQAKVAAANVAGGDESYAGTVPVTVLKVVGIDVNSMGRFEAKSPDDLEIALEEPTEHRYRKLVLADGKLVGAILIGYPRDVAMVSAAVKGRLDVSASIEALRAGNWEVLADGEQSKVATAA